MQANTTLSPEERHEHVADLIFTETWDQLREIFSDSHPADIADWIDRSPRDVHSRLFELVHDEAKADVLSELEAQAGGDILEGLTVEEISGLLEGMAPDDAADVLGDLARHRPTCTAAPTPMISTKP